MSHLHNDDVESVWVELSRLNRKNRGFMVGSIYIPPNVNHSYMQNVHHHLECATSTEKKLVILGDFNIDQQKEPDKIHKLEGEFGVTQLITLNYILLGLIEHHGVFIDSGHYVSYIRKSNKWYHCDDKHITETNLLTLSNNVYLMFYAKEVD